MRIRNYTIVLFLFLCIGVEATNYLPLDSVLKNVMDSARVYSNRVKSYEANVYLRGLVNTKKKNILYTYTHSIPNFVLHDLKNNDAVIETVGKIRFSAPNSYFQDVNFVNGTLTRKRDIALLPLKFLSMNVYNTSVSGESFFLPLREETKRYYNYKLESVIYSNERCVYLISYSSKYKSSLLLNGSFEVEAGSWRIISFFGNRDDLFVKHTFDVIMGSDSINKLLPKCFYIHQSYKYLGNHVLNRFQADLRYDNVEINADSNPHKSYHLGVIYKVKMDSVPLITESALWDKMRTFPLSYQEKRILEKHQAAQEKKKKLIKNDSISASNNQKALDFAKSMVMDTRYVHKSAAFSFSGLLNPSMIGYSTLDGVTYKQTLNMNFDLERQQSIKIAAYGGYVFKRKQLSYQLKSTWNYEPKKLGYVSFAVGRGNPTYSSRFIRTLQEEDLNDLPNILTRYQDNYFKLKNSIEIFNGLQLGTGLDYHIRIPISSEQLIVSAHERLQKQYNFVPQINISWTPGQYYVTDGIQKVYVRSRYPTFKIEYAQCIKDVMQSNSSFRRLEFDVNQNIQFDLLRRLSYHIGVGAFFNQKDEYFNDFAYFSKNYFPESWGDGIGGSFSSLSSVVYNSSQMYAQAHLMYETYRLFLTRMSFLANGVARERLYLSQLYLPLKPMYTEIGYGIGNRFLNAAAFVAFDNWKYYTVGGKAVFLF